LFADWIFFPAGLHQSQKYSRSRRFYIRFRSEEFRGCLGALRGGWSRPLSFSRRFDDNLTGRPKVFPVGVAFGSTHFLSQPLFRLFLVSRCTLMTLFFLASYSGAISLVLISFQTIVDSFSGTFSRSRIVTPLRSSGPFLCPQVRQPDGDFAVGDLFYIRRSFPIFLLAWGGLRAYFPLLTPLTLFVFYPLVLGHIFLNPFRLCRFVRGPRPAYRAGVCAPSVRVLPSSGYA